MRVPVILAFVMFTLFLPAAALLAQDSEESKALKKLIESNRVTHENPHNRLTCDVCHGTNNVKASDDGHMPIAMDGDITRMCYSCHDKSQNIHPVDQLPSMKVPAHLPLHNGHVACTTCHDMHLVTTKDHLLRGFTDGRYASRPDLCIDCHGERFMKKNPHVNQKERGLCVFCHQTEPTRMDNQKTVRFRYGILKTCNFCHNVAEKNHPLNVDKDIVPPKSLPRDIDGSVTCATCHNPHGTADTLHFLRREYIVTMEAARNFNPHKNDCQACHNRAPSKGQSLDAIYQGLKYKGVIGLLCNSCHGTHNIHPVEIAPAKEMRIPPYLPLDPKGYINCITCHDMNCGGGKVKLRLFNEKDGSMKALCYSCHDEAKFAKTNPHKDIEAKEGCLFCHERQPDSKTDTRETVRFITSLRMICLRCHERTPHPAGREHLVMPPMDVPKDLPMDDAGFITCITCHNPHIGGEKGDDEEADRRLRRPGDNLCDACHESKY
jgi:predicted CXXCH cytochrome family protein